MNEPSTYSYPRYLDAKASVDERARNRRVWERFIHEISACDAPIRILEVGGGVGTTVQRIVESLGARGGKPTVHYTFVDREPKNVAAARKRLTKWLDQREGGAVSIDFVTEDLFSFAHASSATYDAIVAQAVLDLLPVAKVLRTLRPLLADDGLWYLPIHFDGVTAFEPPVDPDLDAKIERLYHASMIPDGKDGVDGPYTGRRLMSRLREAGGRLLEAGSSDWVVHGTKDGYPQEEEYFLHHVLHFVEQELSGHPALSSDDFAGWIRDRRRQVERGELIYIAHQLDVLARQEDGSDGV